jgi:hypothetical protein
MGLLVRGEFLGIEGLAHGLADEGDEHEHDHERAEGGGDDPGRIEIGGPWRRSSPQLGVGGGRPKPRKSSAVSELMAPATVNGMNVTMVERVFGQNVGR